MKALVNYSADPHSVEIREIPIPDVGDEEVLITVEAVAVCGSDLHQAAGSHSWHVNYPVVLGHEFSGTVKRVGEAVSNFEPGDRVVSETAAVIDPESPFTRTGAYNLDPARLGLGNGVDGAIAEFVRVPARCLHRIPDGVTFDSAALTEPACVAYEALCVNGRVRAGDAVLVIGPGPIGILCAHIAVMSGANPVVMLGAVGDELRLQLGEDLGAHWTGTSVGEMQEKLTGLTDGYGVDVAVDAAGVSETLKVALEHVRPGGQVIKVGWGRQPADFSLDPLVAKAATIHGSFSHSWATWERVLHLQATSQLQLEPLVGGVWPVEEWSEAFTAMRSGRVVKALIRFGPDDRTEGAQADDAI